MVVYYGLSMKNDGLLWFKQAATQKPPAERRRPRDHCLHHAEFSGAAFLQRAAGFRIVPGRHRGWVPHHPKGFGVVNPVQGLL